MGVSRLGFIEVEQSSRTDFLGVGGFRLVLEGFVRVTLCFAC